MIATYRYTAEIDADLAAQVIHIQIVAPYDHHAHGCGTRLGLRKVAQPDYA